MPRKAKPATDGVGSFTQPELRFIEAYVEHLDASRAALLAGVSARSSATVASRWLSRDDIALEIERRLKARAEVAAVSQADVVRELARIAFFDMRRLFDENGKLLSITEMDADVARSLATFDIVQVVGKETDDGAQIQNVKISPASKLKALELLGKHLAMFTEKHKHEAPEGGFQFIAHLGGRKEEPPKGQG